VPTGRHHHERITVAGEPRTSWVTVAEEVSPI